MGEGLTWSNTGTVDLFGHVAMNPVASDHFSFLNGAGGVLNLQAEDAGLIQHDTDGTDLLTNAGTIALVRSTAANAGAAIAGSGGGTLSLEVTNAGAVTLNAADTNLHVQLDAAGTLKLSTLAFITAVGSSGADTLTALGGTQTLTGGLGADVLTGYTGGNDSFTDAAAGLNGDTIRNWTTGDMIDIKDFASATLAYAGGTLTIGNAGSSTAMKLGAGLALHNFTVVGSDGTGGVLIGYHG